MVEIGKYNNLVVLKKVEHGIYVDGGDLDEILVPKRYVSINTEIGDTVNVFVYYDSEDRLIATTEKPYAQVGDIAYLEVVDVNKFGAFMNWGLMKDLFVPFKEQTNKMVLGNKYTVFIYFDFESERIAASAKIDKYLDNLPPDYTIDQEVDIIITRQTDLGFLAAINNTHQGILYKNEIFTNIKLGDKHKAYIKKVREDEKIDLYLHKKGMDSVGELAKQILDKLKANNGTLNIGDKSDSELIYSTFGVSKKTFKKAIGQLYKERLITTDKEKISLCK